MKLLSVILMILLASPAWAFPPLIAGKTASGGAAVVDGLVGSNVNSANYTISVNNMHYSRFTTTTAGQISYAHIYVETSPASEATVCVSLHTAADNTKRASGSATIATDKTGWVNIALTPGTYNIASSTDYYLAIQTTIQFVSRCGGYTAGTDDCSTDHTGKTTCRFTVNPYNCGSDAGYTAFANERPLRIVFNNTATDPI